MAKIRHGKYIYTPQGAEAALRAADERARQLRGQLDFVEEWIARQAGIHQPYVGGRIDVSISPVERMKDDFLNRLGQNLWCSRCSNPWPCRALGEMRVLRSAIREGADLDTIRALLPEAKPHENSIETAI